MTGASRTLLCSIVVNCIAVSARGGVGQYVARFRIRGGGSLFYRGVNQASSRRVWSESGCALTRRAAVAHCTEAGGESIRHVVRAGVHDFRRVKSTQSGHRRSLVGGHFRANQVRNCDGRDDQNDRHDDHQLDKRKAFLLVTHVYPFSFDSVAWSTLFVVALLIPTAGILDAKLYPVENI